MNFLFKRQRKENAHATGNFIAKGATRLQTRWAKWMENALKAFHGAIGRCY